MNYQIKREQFIPRPLDEVFAFFAQAENLERLTPPWLQFKILSPLPIAMKVGTLIDYRIRLKGLPMRWQSEITEWNPPHGFVDEQRRGPYSFWHHAHRFEARDNGTLMTDEVHYGMPLGPLGRLAHWLMVERDLRRIFDYRWEQVEAIFRQAPLQLHSGPGLRLESQVA